MPEKEQNRVSVKIYEGTLEALKDAQYRARKSGFAEPTYAELIESAIQIAIDAVNEGFGGVTTVGTSTRVFQSKTGKSSKSRTETEEELRQRDIVPKPTVVDTSTSATGATDWRLNMAEAVLSSDHPVAPIALEANIVSFWLQIHQHVNAPIDPDTEARIEHFREENARISAAVKRLHEESERSDPPVQKNSARR